jgi:hypothetical protein
MSQRSCTDVIDYVTISHLEHAAIKNSYSDSNKLKKKGTPNAILTTRNVWCKDEKALITLTGVYCGVTHGP